MDDQVLNAALTALLRGVQQLAQLADDRLPPELAAPTDERVLALVEMAERLAIGEQAAVSLMARQPLQSVFSHLAGYTANEYTPLKRLNPQDQSSLFPQVTPAPDPRKGYADLWQGFKKAYQAMPRDAPPMARLEQLLALLQEYAWCLPAAEPSVSLFDHSRVTAAIAACLAADERSVDHGSDKSRPVCYLVGGDLSGLQVFIYTLASGGAAKSLRARSFYVQLISEASALAVLQGLDLPLTNLLYVGGGGFELLAPLSKTETDLADIARSLNERLLTAHEGGLGLTMKWQAVTYGDFEAFNKVRDELGRRLNIAKQRPFAAASPSALRASLGQPLTEGGDPEKFCRVTGEDGDTVRWDQDDELWKSAFVLSLERLGRLLPRATHVAYAPIEKQPATRATDWQQTLRIFGLETQVVVGSQAAEEMTIPPGEFARVWRLRPAPDIDRDSADERQRLAPLGVNCVVSYRPFARLTPTRKGNGEEFPLTFDELAERPQRKTCSFYRWGVLRLDVDHLGQIFRAGFGDRASLGRMTSLSFALRLFFEGWLPQLAGDDLKDHLYIQYSGGDDVFVVGSWDALPEFARRIRESFAKYVAGNPHLTLSAGITLAEAKFPLYQAAEQADEAEKAAKDFKRGKGQKDKDAVTFLGQTLDWNDFTQVKVLAYQLAEAVENRQLPRALLQTVLALNEQIWQADQKRFRDWLKDPVHQGRKYVEPKSLFGRWTWLAAYQLTRAVRGKERSDKSRRLVEDKIQAAFLKPNSREQLQSIALAARWAQFLARGG